MFRPHYGGLSCIVFYFREIADGSLHTIAIKQNLCCLLLLACLYTTQLSASSLSVYLRSSCLFQCCYQHNSHSLYNMCARSGCLFCVSFIRVILQPHLGASYSMLSWLAEKLSCTKVLLIVRGYHVKLQCQGYAEQHLTDNTLV